MIGYNRNVKPFHTVQRLVCLEHLQQIYQIFVLFGERIVTLTFIYQFFQIHFPTNSLSHLNIISSFIVYPFYNHQLFFF